MIRIAHFLFRLTATLLISACTASGPLLNSDRIEERFGSYSLDVLSQDEDRRISSLYSLHGSDRITRTYAIVEYLHSPRADYRTEHAVVLSGGSIGQTFRNTGWSIRKQNIFIDELEVPPTYRLLGNLMHIELPAILAVHQYLLIISNEERSFSYARITEIHHPDFLALYDLQRIYGEMLFDDSNRDSIRDFLGEPGEIS